VVTNEPAEQFDAASHRVGGGRGGAFELGQQARRRRKILRGFDRGHCPRP
jgi:hypothetical protein